MQAKTPTQLGLNQFLISIIATSLTAGLTSISLFFTEIGPINWQLVGYTFMVAFLFSLAHGFVAYLKALPAPAQGVELTGIATILDDLLSQFQTRLDATKTPTTAIQSIQPTPSIQGPLVSVHTTQTVPPALQQSGVDIAASSTDHATVTLDTAAMAAVANTFAAATSQPASQPFATPA